MLHLNLSIMYGSRVESQMETWIIFHRGSISLIEEILVISRCCFAEDGWEMYTVLNRTCWAIVLPRVLEITSFYRQTRSKDENITQNKAGIEKGMALFRLITLFFFYENVYFWGRDWTFLKLFFSRPKPENVLYLPWVTKTEFLLTISIQYQAQKWWE